jgi:hypothetical protein
MQKIELAAFENATIIGDITQDYIDSLREFSVVYGTYKGVLCYIVTNSYFDNFTKATTWIQTIIALNIDADDTTSIDHVKSRYLKPLFNGTSLWTRWQTEDANTYNYLNGYLKESDKVALRKWKNNGFTESGINLIINTLSSEDDVFQVNFAEHQNELFFVPDDSIHIYSVETLPSPSENYYNKYYHSRSTSTIGNNTFYSDMIYICDINTGADSDIYPYMWRSIIKSNIDYDCISSVTDIPGI